ncbi:MAG: ABC transporter permease [Actinomycetota bacterium]|nr:ABC transporter permease [Actinomycetota bacterium]
MNPEHWQGPTGIPVRTVEHLGYSALTLLIAVAIAVPIGLYVGHTGRGRVVVIAAAGVLRALPTLGMLTLFVLLAGLGLMPPIWALVLLAVPPILAGTYAGISSVSPDAVDAARSMGMTEIQILFRVEVPNGLAVMLGGFRAGVLQVVATVAVVAYINLGGLGRFLIDGLAVSDYGRVLGGAVVIAVLAIMIDLVLASVQRLAISPGLREPRQQPGTLQTGRERLTAGVQGGNS